MKITIDPGKSGAVAFQDPNGKTWTVKCPDTQHEMFEVLEEVMEISRVETWEVTAMIEKVHSMPGQGVRSVWNFSANYASWQMAMVALKIPFVEVPPQKWMKAFGALPKDKKERKNTIKDRMQKKFPDLKVTLADADALAMLTVMEEFA